MINKGGDTSNESNEAFRNRVDRIHAFYKGTGTESLEQIFGNITKEDMVNFLSFTSKTLGFEGLMTEIRSSCNQSQIDELRGLIKGFKGDPFKAEEVIKQIHDVVDKRHQGDLSTLLTFEEIRECITNVLKSYGI